MKRSPLVIAALVLVASPAYADFERRCEDRPLDAAERAAAARIVSAFRAALPVAPAGWAVVKDSERVSAVACETPGETWKPGGKLVPQPVSVHVYRRYLRSAPSPPAAAAEPAPVAVKPAASPGVDPARKKELEAQLGELQRSRKDVQRDYLEARRTGDSAAQWAAKRREQETRPRDAPSPG